MKIIILCILYSRYENKMKYIVYRKPKSLDVLSAKYLLFFIAVAAILFYRGKLTSLQNYAV